MFFFYGKKEHFIDITDDVLQFCCHEQRIHIPGDDLIRATLFSDPVYGERKDIVVVNVQDDRRTCATYPHGTPVDVPLPPDLRPPHRARPVLEPGLPVDEAITRVHEQLTFAGGRLTDEWPEQSMVMRFLDPGAKVLEIGANIGRNTLMIASVLADSANLVTLECDPVSAEVLKCNRAANDFRFHIEPSALSYRPLVQQGWTTVPSDVVLPGHTRVSTVTFEELRATYGLAFDTLVADCEGALYYILQDNPAMLDGIDTVLLEADYLYVEHKRSVEAVFAAHGLTRVHSEPLVSDWDHPFPDEVAASFFEVWTR